MTAPNRFARPYATQRNLPPEARIWLRVRWYPSGLLGTDCAIWQHTLSTCGYAQMRIAGRLWPLHVWTYQHYVGSVPTGQECDHLCHNRACINPLHIEPVTHRENSLRGDRHDFITHCPYGHEYTAENTYRRTFLRNGYPINCRTCKACSRLWHQSEEGQKCRARYHERAMELQRNRRAKARQEKTCNA
jgi:hypothetical protein